VNWALPNSSIKDGFGSSVTVEIRMQVARRSALDDAPILLKASPACPGSAARRNNFQRTTNLGVARVQICDPSLLPKQHRFRLATLEIEDRIGRGHWERQMGAARSGAISIAADPPGNRSRTAGPIDQLDRDRRLRDRAGRGVLGLDMTRSHQSTRAEPTSTALRQSWRSAILPLDQFMTPPNSEKQSGLASRRLHASIFRAPWLFNFIQPKASTLFRMKQNAGPRVESVKRGDDISLRLAGNRRHFQTRHSRIGWEQIRSERNHDGWSRTQVAGWNAIE
jgi:hypothetical protein